MRWAWIVTRVGEMRNAYEILVRELTGKGPLVKSLCNPIWEDNNTVRFILEKQERRIWGWIHLTPNRA